MKTNLSIGMKGEEVGKLQVKLIRAGLSIPKEELYHFDKATQRALKRWQVNNGLRPTGEVDAKTSRKLEAVNLAEDVVNDEEPPAGEDDTNAKDFNETLPEGKATESRRLTNRQRKRLDNLSFNITNEKQKSPIRATLYRIGG